MACLRLTAAGCALVLRHQRLTLLSTLATVA